MNGAQLHLLTNHIPILGVPFALIVLVWGLMRRSTEIQRLGLGMMAIVALATLAAYFTGEPAEEVVEDMPGITQHAIHEHEEAAELGLVLTLSLGVLSAVTLIVGFKKPAVAKWGAVVTIVGALGVSGTMAWVGHLGGEINHPEVR